MRKKEKIKWVELEEDDTIFKGGFIVSNPKMDFRAPDKKRIKKTFLQRVKQSLERLKNNIVDFKIYLGTFYRFPFI